MLLLVAAAAATSVLDLVDPFIGSGGKGFGCGAVPPGAQAPFSGVRLSPDTSHTVFPWLPFEHFGGYQYSDNEIRVFSHLHTQGAGVLDMGILSVLPVAQLPDSRLVTDQRYRSRFSHDHEHASPGYYSVLLQSHGIEAELTAGTHSAAHRYHWSRGEPVILFPLSHALPSKSCKAASVKVDLLRQTVTGHIETTGGFSGNGLMAYFVARFNVSFTGFGTWSSGKMSPLAASVNGTDIGGYVQFKGVDAAEMYVGVSWISEQQAWANLEAEQSGQSFDATLSAARTAWSEALGRVQVSGGSREDLTKFYTALYHVHCAPSTVSEAGGLFVGFDGKVNRLAPPMRAYYSDLSMWDVHRTQIPLLAWLYGDSIASDIVESIRIMTEQLGYLPNWPFVNTHTCTMIGQFGQNMITESYLWGARNYNVSRAYKAIRDAAIGDSNCGRDHSAVYGKLGYLPAELDERSTSLTLAWAHNDFALAAMARQLGLAQDESFFAHRSTFYKNIWSPKEKFYCPRSANGTFTCSVSKLDC